MRYRNSRWHRTSGPSHEILITDLAAVVAQLQSGFYVVQPKITNH